jgi:hypothetical protein
MIVSTNTVDVLRRAVLKHVVYEKDRNKKQRRNGGVIFLVSISLKENIHLANIVNL